MNVYDFDNTILRGDSSARFFAFCLRHYPKIWLDAPGQLINALLFGLHLKHKQEFKQRLFGFLRKIDDVDGAVAAFWEENYSRVKPWYPQNHRRYGMPHSCRHRRGRAAQQKFMRLQYGGAGLRRPRSLRRRTDWQCARQKTPFMAAAPYQIGLKPLAIRAMLARPEFHPRQQ